MQMSPLTLTCRDCGAANTTEATACISCQRPLQFSLSTHSVRPLAQPTPTLLPPAPAGQLLPGSLLNQRYEIVSEVGQGGFSVVYLAKDMQNEQKQVAIKQINLRGLTPHQIIEATDTYNREVGFLSTLKHTNLPHIYEHFTDPDHWYLVMEYIKGETLEDYVQKASHGYLPVQEVLAIGIQLCRVLNVLHRRSPPIIFRDVKPSNIMRTSTGRLYLIDFGIARHFTPGQSKDTRPLGSPGYAAPEQYGRAQTTRQSDIYSLGVTLQELLTGSDPLDTSSTAGQPVPQKLHQLLDHMLEHDSSKRPKSMKEVQWQLKRIKQGRKGAALSYLWGLWWASWPYPLIFLLLFALTSWPQITRTALLHTVLTTLYVLFRFIWPFVALKRLFMAIRYLFSPPKRWIGLGMLTMLVFLAIAIIEAWLPFSALIFPWIH